jgi:hypothetical protein
MPPRTLHRPRSLHAAPLGDFWLVRRPDGVCGLYASTGEHVQMADHGAKPEAVRRAIAKACAARML